MKVTKKKVLTCLWGMKDMYIGLFRPATLPQVIAEVPKIGLLRLSTIPLVITENIILVMLVEVDPGHKRLFNITLTIK